MKIPAVMIYSRKTKLVFCATFKMDISPHQSNKYTDAAASLNLFIVLNCGEQLRGMLLLHDILHLIHTKASKTPFGVPKEPFRITASETSEVKCACFGELYYA